MNKSKKKIAIIDIIVLVVLAIVLGVSMVWSHDIELKLGLLYYVDAQAVDESDIVTLSSGVYASADDEGGELKVHFVNVGQGDCAIIQLPDGKNMIIDAGSGTSSSGPTAVINSVKSYIKNTFGDGFKYFDYAILTHPDSDHCNVLDDVLNTYPARVCYRPNVDATVTEYTDQGKADLTSDARKKNTGVYANAIKAMYHVSDDMTSVVYVTDPAVEEQSISGGEGDGAYSFTFYSPLTKKYGSNDWNNYSPIMILEYQGYKFAMSGDAEVKNLGEFVAKVNSAKTDGITDKYDVFTDDYCVNVIKAGHHGSDNATTREYVDVLTTQNSADNVYCVVSVGANSFGHPKQEALDIYKAVGLPDENVLRTDQKGDISFTVRVDEEGVYSLYYGDIKTQNPNAPTITPDDPNNNENPDDDNNNNPDDDKKPEKPSDDDHKDEKIQVLVYRKLGGIKLKWAVVAWSCYAVVVVLAAVHIALYGLIASDSGAGGKGKKGGRRKR